MMNLRVFLTLKPYLLTVAFVSLVVALKLTMSHLLDLESPYYLILDAALLIFVIIQLRQALSFRKKTEGRFRAIFDSNIIGFIISDEDSNIIEANDYYLNLVGLNRSDLLTKKLSWRQFTPPEWIPVSEKAMRQVDLYGVATPFEKEYVRPNGQRFSVLVGAAKSKGVSISYVLNISDRKAAERELAEAKNRLEENVHIRTRELLEANRELSDTQNFLDSVIENIPNMIFVKDAEELRFVRLNRAGEKLLGYSRLDLLGKNDYDFFPCDQADFFTSKDREVLRGETEVDIDEEPISTKAGTRFLHTKKIPIMGKDSQPLYLLGISEDITEKKAAENQRLELAQAQAARNAAERSNRRLSSLSEASAALNESLDIRSLLTAFCRVTVKTMADWCIIDLYDEKEQSIDRIVALAREGEVPLELKNWWQRRAFDISATEGIAPVIRTGQSRVYNDLSRERLANLFHDPFLVNKALDWHLNASMIVPLSVHGKILGTICFVYTESKQAFDDFDLSIAQDLAKRAALAIENASLYSRASEASRAKSAFLANISHEIRTPLGAMLGFAELVLDDKNLNNKQETYISTIARNGRQLLRLVDEILDLSKVESERIQIEHLSFSLPTLLNEAHALMRVKADEKGLNLSLHGADKLPEKVKSDPLRLRQILLNVIGNAIKFTERGEVVVKAVFKPDNSTPTKGTLQIEVADTGIGMDNDQSTRIFQPFVQADGTMTRKYGGTGLGLFLGRKLARLMGGDVILQQSTPGRGSQFLINVTVEIDRAGTQTPDPRRKESKRRAVGGHVRVLVVDDSADNRMLISAFLATPDIELDQAENGAVGVEKAMAHPYDLVLMDIQMPEMDGYEAVSILNQRGYKNPVVALTAHAMKGDRERCLKAGFDDYLCKPVTRKSLMEMIERYSPSKPPANQAWVQ